MGAYGPDADIIFNRQKEFVSLFLDSFKYPIINNFIRVGILSYDNNVQVVKDLKQYYTLTYLRQYLNDLVPKKDGASIGKAMEVSANLIFPDGRNDALKVLVLFTDATGFADKKLIQKAKDKLQDKNVEIVVVGVGNKAKMADLITMVSYPHNIISDLTSKTFMNSYSAAMEKIAQGEFYNRIKFSQVSILTNIYSSFSTLRVSI